MKILYLSNFFYPSSNGDTIYTDFASQLSARGHEITVIAPSDNLKQQILLLTDRGFDEYHIKVPKYYNVGLIQKGISLLTRPLVIRLLFGKLKLPSGFDVILYESPPISNVAIIKWLREKYRAHTFLILKDIFPQNAVDIGVMKKNSLLHKYMRSMETKLYQVSDVIGCMSEGNIEYLLNNNELSVRKVKYFPNTKSSVPHNDTISIDGIRSMYAIPNNATLFVYGGNMGKPQYIDLLIETLNEFKNDKSVFFLFVGRGTESGRIADCIAKNDSGNALILNELTRKEYEELLSCADVGLITLDPRFSIPNYPSKILSYMEKGIPVLAATDTQTDFKNLIIESKCGLWVPSNDKRQFFEAILSLSKCKDLKVMGENGRRKFIESFNVEQSVVYFERHINDLNKLK